MATESLTSSYVATEGQMADGVVSLAKMKTVLANANKAITYDASGVPTATNLGMVLVASATVSGGAVQTFTVSSLDGDAAGTYLIKAIIITPGGGAKNYGFRFNGDTGNNYNKTLLYRGGGASGGGEGGAESAIYDIMTIGDDDGIIIGYLHCTSGRKRIMTFEGGTANGYYKTGVGSWNNTANNITSISVWASAGANISNGSTLQIWKVA